MNSIKSSKYIRTYSTEDMPNTKPSIIEWCLIISVSLMPFTALKTIGPMGPSEFLILLVFVQLLSKKRLRLEISNTYISRYYMYFFMACIAGTVWNILRSTVFGYQLSGTLYGFMFDCLSYVFILLSLYTFEMYVSSEYNIVGAKGILEYVIMINCFTITILFIISRFSNTLFGIQLLYADLYFAPLATNLHHTSMYLLPLSFLTVYLAENREFLIQKIIYWLFAVFFMYLAIATGSTKAGIGVAVGVVICTIYRVTTERGVYNNKTSIAIAITLLIFILYFIFRFDSLRRLAIDFFVDNDINGGRQRIWRVAIQKWSESPLIGYGFGAHVPDASIENKYWDAHNTFITALLQSGVIGLLIIVYVWICILRDYSFNGYILAASASIFVYFSGGDVLRRIPNWSFIIISYYIIRLLRNESNNPDNMDRRTKFKYEK